LPVEMMELVSTAGKTGEVFGFDLCIAITVAEGTSHGAGRISYSRGRDPIAVVVRYARWF
jgi:hypothetical protein